LKSYRLDSRAGRRRLERLAARRRDVLDPKTVRAAAKIVERVRKGGDRALLESVCRLDGYPAASVAELELSRPEGGAGVYGAPTPEGLHTGFAETLEHAIAAVERYHRPQVRAGYRLDEGGVVLEELRTPLGRVGLYVPGGRASYPSTVVMTAIPARLAGVPEIVVATPPGPYRANPALRYTLHRLGIREVWGMGGAHAVAALAYGTESIRRVDLIAGPGSAWVAAAKSLVAGDVGIDSLAGPSEVVVVAEGGAARDDGAVDRLAADLLAQAEHDPRAAAVLITDDRRLAKRVCRRVGERLADLPTAETARASLAAFGAAFVVASMDEAADVVERLAPEHLQLVGPGAEALADDGAGRRPLPAGAIFLGLSTPEVFGDYVAGPNHVLPTCGTARFASALGVDDFVRRSHRVRFSEAAARRAAPAAIALAEAEGLPAHAASARLRLGETGREAGGEEGPR
jgi:histidinol dehydrogenase